MDEKTLLVLFDKFEKSTAVELTYSDNGSSFELRRKEAFSGCAQVVASQNTQTPASIDSSRNERTPSESSHSVPVISTNTAGAGHEYIKSPIVGTFYRSASPDTPAFAEVGKKVMKGQKLCIIEAMKMMNALEAEFDCEIISILVNNGDMVEYDQNLFEVKSIDKARSV